MIRTLSVGTILALTRRTTGYPCIKAFTVLFLTLTFLTIATFPIVLFLWAGQLMFDDLSSFTNRIIMFMIVMATIAGTLLSTDLARWEALTVHLETFRFFTCATSLLLLDKRGRSNRFILGWLQLMLQRDGGFLQVLDLVGYVLSNADLRARGKVSISLDKKESLIEVGCYWHPTVTILEQVKLTHILYYSLNKI